jgi:hypothetical protein
MKIISALLTGLIFQNAVASAQTWTQASVPSNGGWMAIASSADGNKLFAISFVELTYATSTNAGTTWTAKTEPLSDPSNVGHWTCIASSADGNTLLAMNSYNTVWASTNSGISWASNVITSANSLASVALSADGTKAVAVDGSLWGLINSGGIYTSTNSGMTWSQTTAPIEPWSSVTSSADGTVLAATAWDGSPAIPVYVSTNSGLTWMPTATPSNMDCTVIACSADGRKIIVGGEDVSSSSWVICTSTNSGNTWVLDNVSSNASQWYGVASSADGTRLIACTEGSNPVVFTSTDSGATWITNSLPNHSWMGVAASADGGRMAAAYSDAATVVYGGIYTSQTTPTPQLNVSLTNGTMTLSWLIPSTNFILQQSSDLASWSAVTNTPVLNFTNLQNQVALPVSTGNVFYRLKAP